MHTVHFFNDSSTGYFLPNRNGGILLVVIMDKNFIKDNRVFPEEMHESSQNTSSEQKENHTGSIVWWIIGLLVLLCIVFFVGLWAGKKTAQVVQDRNNQAAQEERQEIVDNFKRHNVQSTPEERTERLRTFFADN